VRLWGRRLYKDHYERDPASPDAWARRTG